jgi:hypothetical protein
MRPLFYVLSSLAVVLLAAWAYQENFRTQTALRNVETLQLEIGRLRERRAVLAAEWAWLTRPERLRELSELNYDRLGLLPLLPTQFARIDEVPFSTEPPIAPALPVELVELGADQ